MLNTFVSLKCLHIFGWVLFLLCLRGRSKVAHSLVLRGEQVDRPLLSGFTPVWLVHLHHLLYAEAQTLEDRREKVDDKNGWDMIKDQTNIVSIYSMLSNHTE